MARKDSDRMALGRWLRTTIVGTAVVVASLAGAARAGAQAPIRTVEFEEAVQRALAEHPSVATAEAEVARANAVVKQVRAATWPSVSLSAVNTTLDGARGFDGGVTQPRNQFTFSGSASAPLVDLLTWASVGQARDQVQVSTLRAAEARQQIAVAAAEAYLAVIAARRQLEVDDRALATSQAHLEYADARLEGGAGSRVNQLRAAQEVATAEARLEATRLALLRAQEALGVLLVEDGPVDAGAEPVFETPEASEDTWAAARRDLQRQAAVVRAAERGMSDVWKAWLPRGSVSFDPVVVTPSGLFQPSRTWRLTFAFTQPIFDSRPAAELALREVEVTRAGLDLTLTEIQARSEVRVAEQSVLALERALEQARLAAERADEVLRITTAAFELGATTNIEVIDAQRSARDAETQATVAEDAVRRAHLNWLVAVGQFPE